MGRWTYSHRRTVEECRSVSVTYLRRNGFLDALCKSSQLTWSRNGEITASIGIESNFIDEDNPYVRLTYTSTNRATNKEKKLDYKVLLTSTPCHFGGKRWWFICPLTVNGIPCRRRLGVLYLGGDYFGCRHCHDLTYESVKENHRYDALFRRMGYNPKDVRHFFRSRQRT